MSAFGVEVRFGRRTGCWPLSASLGRGSAWPAAPLLGARGQCFILLHSGVASRAYVEGCSFATTSISASFSSGEAFAEDSRSATTCLRTGCRGDVLFTRTLGGHLDRAPGPPKLVHHATQQAQDYVLDFGTPRREQAQCSAHCQCHHR